MFIKIRIYCKKEHCCFDDIIHSKQPTIYVNKDHIVSLGEREDWGMCENHEDYPYRELSMSNGTTYLVVLQDANRLADILDID